MANRTPQPIGTKGSLAWMQALVNRYPDRLNTAVEAAMGADSGSIRWVSPLADDDCAEYRDQGFLDKLGISLSRYSLTDFWPSGGPQWDALATTPTGVVLVEAKAHLNELGSKCAAGSVSLARIQESIRLVQRGIGLVGDADWTTQYYQYANRLAHLYLLRELNGIETDLVLLCFLNDHEMRGPQQKQQWLDAFDAVDGRLSIQPHPLLRHVHHVFVDVVGMEKLSAGHVSMAYLKKAGCVGDEKI
jgi:hypothetical protein